MIQRQINHIMCMKSFLKDKRKNLRTKVELYIVENFSNKSKTLVKY